MRTKTKTYRVEYLRALDDNTWDTFIAEVPLGMKPDDYATKLAQMTMHRRVVLFAVYNLQPDEDE